MKTDDVIQELTRLGFSSYEAKAYYALLQKSPAIGYEVSKIARIPTAKIYEVLTNLKNKEVIFASSSDPAAYIPVPPQILLRRLKESYLSRIENLTKHINQIKPISDIDITWNLKSHRSVFEKVNDLIDAAEHSLLVSVWPEEVDLMREHLMNAEKRGVEVIAAVFGDSDVGISQVVNLERCGVTSQRRLGKRLTVVIADTKEAVISEVADKDDTVGISTRTPCIVLVAKEYIKHDIWGHYLIEAMGEERFRRMCESEKILSYIINNR